MSNKWIFAALFGLGSFGLLACDVSAQVTEVMVSSADVNSSVTSVTINLPTGTKTTYRVVYAIEKDATAGTLAVYTNGDTTGVWVNNKYGAIGTGSDLVNTTATGCLISINTNNQDANSILQGQFQFSSMYENDKVGLIYGLETFTNGNATNKGQESGGCMGPTETANISSIAFRSLTGNIAKMHWELWKGVTHVN